MRKRQRLYFVFFSLMALGLLQAGCVFVSNSPSPRFYMAHSIAKDRVLKKFDFPTGVFIGVGPVRVPEYIDRPQMVTQGKDGLLNIAQFERWAEPLDSAVIRLIVENLILMLEGANPLKFPWDFTIPVKYQVDVDVIQMDSDLEENLTLTVRWNIFDVNTRQILFSKRSQLVQAITSHNYFGLSEAFSAAIASLSSEIAEQLSITAKQGEKG